jgi:hypothetical protein
MDKYNPVGWFEIPVGDLDRAEKFYNAVLGITLARQPEMDGLTMSWFPWTDNVPGATGALVLSPNYLSAPLGTGVIIYFTAPDLEAALQRVTEAGGAVIIPPTDIGEYGTLARVQDTEGNHVCLHTAKKAPEAPRQK